MNMKYSFSKVTYPETLKTKTVEELKELFLETDKKENTQDLYTVRGWIMDALQDKMSYEEFDNWLDEQ